MRLVGCNCSGQPPRSQGRNTDRHYYDCGHACLYFHGFLPACCRSESRLQEYFLQVANRKAAAEPVKTGKFSGAFRPRAKVIERANKRQEPAAQEGGDPGERTENERDAQQNRHIWADATKLRKSILRVLRLTDKEQIRLRLDDHAQPFAKNRVGIHQQYPYGFRWWHIAPQIKLSFISL